MTAHDLLSELRAKGVEVRTSGDDRLVVDAPKGTITEDLKSALSAHKAELLRILKAEQTKPTEDVVSEEQQPAPVAQYATAAARPLTIAPEVMSHVAKEPGPAAPPPRPPVKQVEEAPVVASTADEISRLEAELMRLRTEEEGRRAEIEAARLSAENALRIEQERWRQQEEETARQRAQKERQRIEVEAREQAEEEHHRQIAEQELRRAEEELKRMRAMEEMRRAEVDAQRLAAQAAHESELTVLRQAEEEHTRHRTEQERHYLETEARKRAQEDELRRRAEMRFRAVEEEIERVQTRDAARFRAVAESQRLAEDVTRRRAEEEARRHAESEAVRRAEEEARLREEAQRLAAEQARRLAEAEARHRADEEARRQAEEAARLNAEDEARRQAQARALRQAEDENRLRAEAEVRQRAELEARIRAEVDAKIRAEEADRHETEAARRRAEHERILAEEAARTQAPPDRAEVQEPLAEKSNVTEITEWFDAGIENREPVRAIEPAPLTLPEDHFGTMHDDAGGEFAAVSVPETPDEVASSLPRQFNSEHPSERAAAISELPHLGGEEAFQQVSAAFDDQSVEVRNAAARAMSELQEDRAAAFTRALREGSPERRRRIGSAIASSGLANEAIRNLTGESRDKTYDAFSLLFLMSKAGELQPLMRAIEDHSNIEVRLAVVKLLALSGQPDILPAFRRMAVRGSLPPEVRSAIMEAIYQITSQSPAEAPSMS